MSNRLITGTDVPRTLVTAQDAPFPEEHQERTTRNGEPQHIRWIPETSPYQYITYDSAMNLYHDTLGEAGDWHESQWWVPNHHDQAKIHLAHLSTDPCWNNTTQEIIELLRTAELVDCRPALADLGHRAAQRLRPVWSAIHVRAILESGWWTMRENEGHEPGITLQAVDPTTVARWLGTRAQWLRLHDLGDRIGTELAPRHALETTWRHWLACQTPLAHHINPAVRWNLETLDHLAAGRTLHG